MGHTTTTFVSEEHIMFLSKVRGKNKTRALRALAGVGLSLEPEGKEKSSWSHSSANLVFTARNAVAL